MSNRLKRVIPVFFVILLIVALGVLSANQTPNVIHAQGDEAQTTPVVPFQPGLGNPYLIADVAEQVTPAVVYVEATWPARERGPRHPFADDPFFRDFFPFNPWPDSQPQVQRGTGFIIDEEGYVLTNQHVVGNPGGDQTVTVKLHTDQFQGELTAELLGADDKLDLAVLKIELPDELDRLPTISLGNSDASRPGEWVIAVGNPYGEQFEHTVTVGVLSATGREIQIYENESRTWKTYRNLMQTDAAINPGNSGGPLINIQGEVIGINTAVNASAQGIGFAIPINTAISVMQQLIDDGHIRWAFLGVGYENLTPRDAALAGLTTADGVLVLEVIKGSAAEEAGIKEFDVIRNVAGKQIKNTRDLQDVMETLRPDEEVSIIIVRKGEELTLQAILGERPEEE